MFAKSHTEEIDNKVVSIKSVDEERQIVYGEIYAPWTLDTYGDFMTPDGIEEMAHNYLKIKNLGETIDTFHDNVPTSSYPVESFIARKGDPDYTEGAWVVGVKVDDTSWHKIKSGEINGFSMQTRVKVVPAVVEAEIGTVDLGVTEEAKDHRHFFFVELDTEGRVVKGVTSQDKGHTHEIRYGTATEINYGHAHRFFI